MELGGLGALETGFEAVAQGHQFIDFGDDAVLLGEGGTGVGQSFTSFK